MYQNELKPQAWANKDRMRVWRWCSWKWRTCWRWDKWQNARKSGKVRIWFEWWQNPIIKRLPKLKWFNNKFKTIFQVVNVWDLNIFDWKEVNIESLYKANLISSKSVPCKVLWNWELTAKIKIFVNWASWVAKTKIENAWGVLELIK